MFIRKKKNRSGNISVLIVVKSRGVARVSKSFGSSNTAQGVPVFRRALQNPLEALPDKGCFLDLGDARYF